jgi:hypothetical protein
MEIETLIPKNMITQPFEPRQDQGRAQENKRNPDTPFY